MTSRQGGFVTTALHHLLHVLPLFRFIFPYFLGYFPYGTGRALANTGIICGILQRQHLHRHARQSPLRTAGEMLTRDRFYGVRVGYACLVRAAVDS